ncbi:hypothetical protein L2E82_20755 [Cichorium intybus]|uniref:Uncharacterized protein n=1 Tax=Cichorium intybus TaxID=13427 RepID=A0ACB9DUN1_CICIN|nr:hypothetical protein L2E82_20755 [Cichorium intybus]
MASFSQVGLIHLMGQGRERRIAWGGVEFAKLTVKAWKVLICMVKRVSTKGWLWIWLLALSKRAKNKKHLMTILGVKSRES